MGTTPDIAELEATISRMETRFDADPRADDLMKSYRDVGARFANDLSDPRDLLLSQAAALMMIKYQLD